MPPSKDRIGNWNSNGRLSIYLFVFVFLAYVVLETVSLIVKGPAPDGMIPVVTAAFAFAVTMHSADQRIEERQKEQRTKAIEEKAEETEHRASDLEEFAEEANPDVAKRTIKSKQKPGGDPDE